jgi:4-amino-4-deoxy-L-arabinose transferase-like glycosyltransferase
MRGLLKSDGWILAALLFVLLVVGLAVGNDYGISTDEPANAVVGQNALKAYLGPTAHQTYLRAGPSIAHHGPSYFMLWSGLAPRLAAWLPGWQAADGRHFINYLTFLLAIPCFFWVSRRLLSRPLAWLTTALFASQPMLVGHAFINQKDLPFLSFFLAVVVCGLAAGDRMTATGAKGSRGADGQATRTPDILRQASAWRKLAGGLTLVGLTLVLADLLGSDTILAGLRGLVTQAYEGRAWAPVTALFRAIAQDAYKSPLSAYLLKLDWAYGRAGRLVVLGMMLAAAWLILGQVLPGLSRAAFAGDRRGWALVLLCAALLGFTISMRPVGAFAGLLVLIDWIARLRGRAIAPTAVFGLAAAVLCYLTWPYLWDGPLARWIQSAAFTARFHSHRVLFQRAFYESSSLPVLYVPTLITLQLTELVAPLFVIGLAAALREGIRRGPAASLLLILVVWFSLPALGVMLLGMAIYNNLRHLLFLIPAIVLVAGYGLQAFLGKLRRPWLVVAAGLILLLPGFVGIARLHPYEYTYFNAYTGGTRGAYRQYDLDYWCTSLREAVQEVNAHASPGALVYLTPIQVSGTEPFARSDLRFTSAGTQRHEAEYWMECTRYGDRDRSSDDRTSVLRVQRQGAVFAEAWRKDAAP